MVEERCPRHPEEDEGERRRGFEDAAQNQCPGSFSGSCRASEMARVILPRTSMCGCVHCAVLAAAENGSLL
jgi:hypothetical protein